MKGSTLIGFLITLTDDRQANGAVDERNPSGRQAQRERVGGFQSIRLLAGGAAQQAVG